jgi:hypothetical protein
MGMLWMVARYRALHKLQNASQQPPVLTLHDDRNQESTDEKLNASKEQYRPPHER